MVDICIGCTSRMRTLLDYRYATGRVRVVQYYTEYSVHDGMIRYCDLSGASTRDIGRGTCCPRPFARRVAFSPDPPSGIPAEKRKMEFPKSKPKSESQSHPPPRSVPCGMIPGSPMTTWCTLCATASASWRAALLPVPVVTGYLPETKEKYQVLDELKLF